MNDDSLHDARDDELGAILGDEPDSTQLIAIGESMNTQRPVPSAASRSRLRSRIANANVRSRPPRLRLLVAAYVGAGVALLGIVGGGLAGIGPFAP